MSDTQDKPQPWIGAMSAIRTMMLGAEVQSKELGHDLDQRRYYIAKVANDYLLGLSDSERVHLAKAFIEGTDHEVTPKP